MKEETYQQVKVQTDELIEHINNERAEINNVKEKLTTQTLENIITTSSSSTAAAPPPTKEEEEEKPTEQAPSQPAEVVSVVQVSAASSEEKEEGGNDAPVSSDGVEQHSETETNWLNQVITK
jgi:ribosomal protein L12E/L44/L45/RPP1/RPP2